MDAQSRRRARTRRWLRRAARLFQAAALRVTVRGQEHIPARGPLLVLFNHLSNLDGPLVVANFPHDLELVGPGDFRLLPIGQWALRAYAMTLIPRGRADRGSLKAIIEHLKAGRMLAMAPEGGTWEKRLSEVKPGAAYVSQVTQAPILPVGLGGVYGVEWELLRLRRPRVTVTFGEVMPPVPPSADRRQREADLEAASAAIVARIYSLLPPEDRARYDRWGRETYELRVEFTAPGEGLPLACDGPPLPDMAALGELLAKPNLFRPLWQNAGLDVEPFRQARFFAPIEVQITARRLQETLSAGDFRDYLPYRLGEAKAAQALAALEALRAACDWAMARDARMRLVPVVNDPLNAA